MAERIQTTSPEEEKLIFNILAIHVGPKQGEPMELQDTIEIDERGIVGGRYPDDGFYTGKRIPDEDRGVTLISAGGVEEANEELKTFGITPFSWTDTRRDIVVDASPDQLNSLKEKNNAGRQVKIGSAVLEATDPCTPCVHLAELRGVEKSDWPRVVKAFLERGGMRFKVISGGSVSMESSVDILDR
jgi:hypothetical protein